VEDVPKRSPRILWRNPGETPFRTLRAATECAEVNRRTLRCTPGHVRTRPEVEHDLKLSRGHKLKCSKFIDPRS
jgi:hypothetical protein